MEDVKFGPHPRRWLWFVALYLVGVATLAVLAFGLRALLKLFVQT